MNNILFEQQQDKLRTTVGSNHGVVPMGTAVTNNVYKYSYNHNSYTNMYTRNFLIW